MSKKIKLTNWQVPRNPELARFDLLKNAKPIDMKDYENVGSVEHHDDIKSVVNKMISKNEKKTGRKLDGVETSKINLNGVNDNRKNKTFFKVKK